MSRTLNKVQLIGRLGADPELRYTQSGTPVAKFSLATNRQWQGKDGNPVEETDWHSIVVWDKLAQTCSEYLTKGRLVYIEGRIQYRQWEFEGQTRYKTEIVATDMLILDSKPSAGAEQPVPEPAVEDIALPAPSRAARNGSATRTAPAPAQMTSERTATYTGEEDPDDLPF